MPAANDTPWYRRLGPGFITGAADDDPSGIATYAQAGAQVGTSMLWTLLLTLPLMISIQLVSARLGRVSGQGVVANIRRHHSPWLAYAFVALVTVANVPLASTVPVKTALQLSLTPFLISWVVPVAVNDPPAGVTVAAEAALAKATDAAAARQRTCRAFMTISSCV